MNIKKEIFNVDKNANIHYLDRYILLLSLIEEDTGNRMSEVNKIAMSKRTKNTMVVRDEHNNLLRVRCDDDKVLSGEYVFYRKGTKHSTDTIEKIRLNNGIRNKSLFYNPLTKEQRYFYNNGDVPDGFVYGRGDEYKKKKKKMYERYAIL